MGLKYGMIGGFIALAWLMLLFFTNQETTGLGLLDPYFCIVVLTAVVYMSILHKRDKELNGTLTIKEGVIAGMLCAFMMGLMIGAYKFVYVKYLDPGFIDAMVKQAHSFSEGLGDSPEQIKNAEDAARASYSPFGQLTFGIGISMLLGLVVSVVCSVIMQKKSKP